jgi:transposase, IS30 family
MLRMKEYTQLKIEERVTLCLMKQKGIKNKTIAEHLGRDRSTISRELKRNQYDDQQNYIPDIAHKKAQARKHTQVPKIEKNGEIKKYLVEKLKDRWSPGVIAGRLSLENKSTVTTETIYRYIYSDAGKKLCLSEYLATRRKKRNQRHERKPRKTSIPERVSVHERPDRANQRLEAGHLEGDLTFFTGNQSSNIMVITERVSRFSFFVKNESKNAKEVGKNLFNSLASLPPELRKSIAFDNGGEFANHRLARDFLGIETYFCDPHSPWQKGQVEKTNAMLHRFIPKKSSITPLDENSLKDIQNQFNSIPRKVLGYKTPAEIFNLLLENVALHA